MEFFKINKEYPHVSNWNFKSHIYFGNRVAENQSSNGIRGLNWVRDDTLSLTNAIKTVYVGFNNVICKGLNAWNKENE